MPTGSEFEAAAQKFTTAAGLVHELVTAASGAGSAQVLQGGSLGSQVSERIAAAAQTAGGCQQAIMEAAAMCLERAAAIAEYEGRLASYDIAVGSFNRATERWAVQFNAWLLDDTGLIARPSNPPQHPRKPVAPAAWADVRRP